MERLPLRPLLWFNTIVLLSSSRHTGSGAYSALAWRNERGFKNLWLLTTVLE